MRTFLALDLDPGVKRTLSELIAAARPLERGARWVRQQGLHVTLAFLGDTRPDQIETIRAAIGPVARATPTFSVRIGGLGGFPRARAARVAWVGVHEESGALARLHAGIEGALSALGHPPEARRFHPHVTLARARRRPIDVHALEALCADLAPDLGGICAGAGPRARGLDSAVARVVFYSSLLTPDGAKYDPIASFAFGGGRNDGEGR